MSLAMGITGRRAPKIKGTICITEFIKHIVQENKSVFTNMKYDSNCFFYHDALTRMTNKDMKEWIREKGYLNIWVLLMKVFAIQGFVFWEIP